tara:strand:+ start:180 stop:1505 length:1326 start_codon:yes stop_codon:yes gene_type:complete
MSTLTKSNLTKRRNAQPPEAASDTDAGSVSDAGDAPPQPPIAKPKEHSKGEAKRSKVVKRLVFGTGLMVSLCGILAMGHVATLALVVVVQIMMFRELVNVRYNARKFDDVPLFRTTQWGWFFTCLLYSYGQAFYVNERLYSLISSTAMATVLRYVELACMILYSAMLVTTVLTLKKDKYKYQMGQLAWTMAVIVIVVAQVQSFIENIFNGLFWFLFPVALVICNDSMAYFCGMGFGKKLFKRRDGTPIPFLALSPNKTWEGFVGGGVCTVIFAFWFPVVLSRMSFLICPCEDLSTPIWRMACTPSDVFVPMPYPTPLLESLIGVGAVTLRPVQFHALPLGLFASVVAPFGGFFASGIKRAYGLSDFAALIPGHGGVFDRVDCQLIMGLATQIYHTTFIGAGAISIARILTLASHLPDDDQVALYKQLKQQLQQQGLVGHFG